MHAWRLRRNVLQRDLRAAVKDLTGLAERRAARARPNPQRNFRPLSEGEAEAIAGTDLLATLAASVSAPK